LYLITGRIIATIEAAITAQYLSREVQIGTAALLSQLPPIAPLSCAHIMIEFPLLYARHNCASVTDQ